MSFSDIIKGSFLENYGNVEIGLSQIIMSLGIALVLSAYIYFCYRYMTRRSFYSKSFNISLVALCIITTAIILTIQSSFVVSLGMVGALSIVRFRTAIKEPMDLVYLFWSISVGIICGAGLFKIAVITSLLVTLAICLFDRLPSAQPPLILTATYAHDKDLDKKIDDLIKDNSKHYSVKSRSVTGEQISLVCEIRGKSETSSDIPYLLSELDGVYSASLLSHDGEVTF